MRSNMPPPPYGAKVQMQSHPSSKPKSHSMQSMQQSSAGSSGYHHNQTQHSNRSLESANNGSSGMSSYFQNRYACGINASPESAMSPSISSVATSTSEVSFIVILKMCVAVPRTKKIESRDMKTMYEQRVSLSQCCAFLDRLLNCIKFASTSDLISI